MPTMREGRLNVYEAIPGTTSLNPLVTAFARQGDGIVTAFRDSMLPALHGALPEDSELEIISFSQLVGKVLAQCGELTHRMATASQQLAAIRHVARSLPSDSPFRLTHRFAGQAEAIVETLGELHAWGINAAEMEALATVAPERVSQKLVSLAQLDRESREILLQLGRETHTDQIRSSFDAVAEGGLRSRVLVFAGSEVHPLRVKWLRWLVSQGGEVTVVLDRHATDGDIFRGSQELRTLFELDPISVGSGHSLLQNLFASSQHDGPTIDVTISSAADPLAEVEWALRRAISEDPEDGFGIYVRNLEGYAPLIETAAKRLGVPIQLARRAPLLTNAFVRLTLTVIEATASNDVRKLLPILSSSYLGLTGNQQGLLSSGIREAYAARTHQWMHLRTWVELHSEMFPWLIKVLDWREKVISVPVELAEWSNRLRDLVHELPWHAPFQSAKGYDPQRDVRAFSVMQSVIASDASIAKVTGRESLNLPAFAITCRELWTAADVSVPAGQGPVVISSDAATLGGVGTLCVLGMLEGVFPKRRSEDPILTDEERETISGLRVEGDWPPLPTSRDEAAAERDEFYRVCAAAKRELVFSYPLTDDSRDNIPAFYLQVIRQSVPTVHEGDYPRPLLAPPIDECLAPADRALRIAMDGPRDVAASVTFLQGQAPEILVPDSEAAYSPQELRDALQCAFMFVARHRLKLQPRRRGERWSRLRHLPQAAQLSTRTSPSEAEAAMILALETELDRLYAEVPEWELQLLRAGGRRLIRDWVWREFASRKAWPKNPESTRPNVRFGAEGLRDTMPGNVVRLAGVAPALSAIDRTSVLHLYGATPKETNDLNEIEKLYYGLYFLALHEPGRESAIEIESMTGKRSLLLLTRSGTRPLRNSVQDGLQVIDLSTQEDAILSKKEFYQDVIKLVRKAVARIRSVDIQPTPGDHCDVCDYGELCRRSKQYGEEDSPFGPDSYLQPAEGGA